MRCISVLGACALVVLLATSPAEAAKKPREHWEKVLTELYTKHNPDKLKDISGVLDKYAGNERKLVKAIREKYEPGTAEKTGATAQKTEKKKKDQAETHYSVLGVAPTASAGDIKKAYRKLSRQYHPDKQGGDKAMFEKVGDAYNALSDATERSAYDASIGVAGDKVWWADETRITNIDPTNFQSVIDKAQSNPLIIVHYTSDTNRCVKDQNRNACLDLIPEVQKMVLILERQYEERGGVGPKPVVAAVDCKAHMSICQRGAITTAPTIKLLWFAPKNWPPGHPSNLPVPKMDVNFPLADKQGRTAWGKFHADGFVDFFNPYFVDHLTRLTPTTFQEQVLESEQMWLVMYSAGTWCPPCMKALPYLRRAAIETYGKAKVGFVQCDNKAKAQYMQSDAGDGSHAICDGETSDFHVTGYPTLVVYPRGISGKHEDKDVIGKGPAMEWVGDEKGNHGFSPGVTIEMFSEMANLAYMPDPDVRDKSEVRNALVDFFEQYGKGSTPADVDKMMAAELGNEKWLMRQALKKHPEAPDDSFKQFDVDRSFSLPASQPKKEL